MKTTCWFVGSVLSSSLLVGCFVPQSRYDQATQKLTDERAAHDRAEQDLAQAKAEVARLESALHDKEQGIQTRENEIAQSRLDTDRISTERDDAVVLVEQIRGELARTGEHLREFSEQKKELEDALAAADAKAAELDAASRMVERKELLMRDVSLGLGDDVTKGKVELTAVEGKPAVRFPAKDVFDGVELRAEGTSALERLAETVAQRPGARLELTDLSTDGATAEQRIARLKRVADVLTGKGIAFERIGFAVAPTVPPSVEAGTPASPAAEAEPANAKKPRSAWREGPDSLEIVIDTTAT